MVRMMMRMDVTNTSTRAAETFAETCARYLARYGLDGLRKMAAEYRLQVNHGARGARPMPLRYATAARVLAAVTA